MEMAAEFCLRSILSYSWGSLTCRKLLRHGTDGFTSPPKEVVLQFLSPLKIHRPQPGFNPRTLGPVASTLPLGHRGLLLLSYCVLETSQGIVCKVVLPKYMYPSCEHTVSSFHESARGIT
jgi:hypothetical protein